MRVHTTQKHYLTCDLYEYTGPMDNRVYATSRQIRISLLNEGERSQGIACAEPLRRFDRIQNIRDAGGNVVFPARADNPLVYEVASVTADVDIYGFNNGYRMTLRRVSL